MNASDLLVLFPDIWMSGAQAEKEFFLNLCTRWSLTKSDHTRCCGNTIWTPEDEQDIAQNMFI